ncbi:DUF4097 family beta strand repeat-containing protein [Lederbergia wuyishanensis]|uniref:DUF4097 and DUF4098 domain-containing protein YvlB n=1 Tax=Lederbergia wuyishanensis TaxID=1347903 RepID=A0ABU0D6K7_9BACI|nr:DUF4097 family beta strand repeat-containing protein [Lederbergia wuyishanensis]MCJ8008539.1 DUF4097 domain-containing protein [Lederbergia wuyishanensis]MDQ0344047.1 DUF4097 and DUF4098 domain-containing protein YvlB [Lederbergia wuyishanensis]
MNNIKIIATAALFLLLVGIVGSIATFKSVTQSEQISDERLIEKDFSNITITSNNSKVEIYPSNDSKTSVELSGKVAKNLKYTFSADVEGDTLNIELKEKLRKLFNFDFFATSLTLKVYVPEKEYDIIQSKSNNGYIKAEKLKANEFTVNTDNGRIHLKDIKSSTVTTKASNGMIDMKNITATSVETKAANGKVNLDNVEGKIVAKVNNGRVTLTTNNLDRPIDIESDNGEIIIKTDKEPTNAKIDVTVHNGKADIFGQSNRNVVYGSGENIIKLVTHNGRITVNK